MNDETITSLLGEIRDNQRQALDQQRTQLDIARSHLEQAKAQIAESLMLHAKLDRAVRGVGRFDCRATVDDQLVCEARLLAAVRDVPPPAPIACL